MLKFVSYSGKYPCLCYGILIIEFNEKKYTLDNILSSGGSVWFDEEWSEHVEEGDWVIRTKALPKELKPYSKELKELVNDNISKGCCGGCV